MVERVEDVLNVEPCLSYFSVGSELRDFTVLDVEDLWALLKELKLMSNKNDKFILESSKYAFVENPVGHLWIDS